MISNVFCRIISDLQDYRICFAGLSQIWQGYLGFLLQDYLGFGTVISDFFSISDFANFLGFLLQNISDFAGLSRISFAELSRISFCRIFLQDYHGFLLQGFLGFLLQNILRFLLQDCLGFGRIIMVAGFFGFSTIISSFQHDYLGFLSQDSLGFCKIFLDFFCRIISNFEADLAG
jgi:hypothetical protein